LGVRRLGLVIMLLTLAVPPSVRADWEVKRSPFDPRLVARYKDLLAKNPDDAYALRELSSLYKRFRTPAALIAEYTPKDGAKPNASSLVVLGHLLLARGDLDGAAARYEEALTLRPASRTQEALGDIRVTQKRIADAVTLLTAALDKADAAHKKALRRRLADLALRPERGLSADEAVEEARNQYQKLLDLDNNDDESRRELAELYASHGKPALAAVEWHKLAERLARDPGQRAAALKREGELRAVAGDDTGAIAVFNQVYAAVPRGHYLRREITERLVAVYRKKEELRQLAVIWDQKWPVGTRDFVEWDALARLWDELADLERATECFRRALLLDGHALEARRRLIGLLDRAGHDEEAIAELRRLCQAAPGEPRFQLELAERLRRSAGPNSDGGREAERIADRVSKETRDASIHNQLADLYQRWGLTDRALGERERLVQLEPNDESHLVNLGELHFQRGQRDKALTVWKRLLTVGGKREQSMARLAEVYAEHDLPGEALDLYQKAVKLAPAELDLRRGLAQAYERLKREGDAEQAWLELFELATTRNERALGLDARQHLVSLAQKRGTLALKLVMFRARIDSAPSEPIKAAWVFLAADSLSRLSQPEEAVRTLDRFFSQARTPEIRADVKVALAHLYKQRRRLKDAVAALEEAAALMPSRARELYAQIADLSLQLYRDADALSYAEKALSLGAPDAAGELRLAEVFERRDQIDDAVAAYRKALQIDDRQWRTYFTLARLQLRRGQPTEAARLYREVIRRAPDEEMVLDATRRAIDLEEYLGTLGELERELQPLAYLHADKKVYRNLLLELYDRFATPLLGRARRGEVAARAELRRLGEGAVRPLLDVLIDGEAPQIRIAVSLLGEMGGPSAVLPLLRVAVPRTLASPSTKAEKRKARRTSADHDLGDSILTGEKRGELKAFALGALRAVDNTGGVGMGVPRLGIDVRAEAAFAAARLATAKDAPALVALCGEREKHLRLAGLYGLGRAGGPGAVDALEAGLNDALPEVQALAAIGLGRQKAPRAPSLLIKVLGDPARAGLVRGAAAVGLGLAGGGSDRPNDRASDRDHIEAALANALEASGTLSDSGDELQRKAAWALSRIGGPRAKSALASAIWKRDEVRLAALQALQGPLPLDEPDRGLDGIDVRAWMARLPGALPSETSLAHVWLVGETELGAAAIEALGQHRDVVLRVLADLDSREDGLGLGPLTTGTLDPAERRALDELGVRLRPQLQALAQRTQLDPAVRSRAVEVLGKIRGGLPSVMEALADPSEDVRLAALAVLGHRGGGEDATSLGQRRQALMTALGSPRWPERRRAALGLGALDPQPALAALRKAASDEQGLVREAAAVTLGSVGEAALPTLATLARDPVAEVQQAAQLAVCRIRRDCREH